MISHTINKYEERAYVHHTPTTITKTKDQLEEYKLDLISRGYYVGARCKTHWMPNATIHAFVDIPENGITYYNKPHPDMFYITKDGSDTPIRCSYNESEIELLK